MFSILAMAPRGVSFEKKMFSGVEIEVHEVRPRDDGDEPERDRRVEEPHAQMRAAQRALGHAEPEHRLPSAQPTGDHGPHAGLTTASGRPP